MKVKVCDIGTAGAMVRIAGDVDQDSSFYLLRELLDLIARGRSHIVVTLAGVERIDSSGLGSLLAGSRRAEAFGGSLAVVPGSARVALLFEALALGSLFSTFADEQSALRFTTPRQSAVARG